MNFYNQLRRDRHFGEAHLNPLDVFRWVDEAYAPVTLLQSVRNPHGHYYGLFELIWDGEVHQIKVVRRATSFIYWNNVYRGNPELSRRYGKNTSISRLMRRLIQTLDHRTKLFHRAQDLILGTVMYNHVVGSSQKSWSSQGHYGGGVAVNLDRGQIKVKVGEESDQFSVSSIVKSITDQLQPVPQQLKLFA